MALVPICTLDKIVTGEAVVSGSQTDPWGAPSPQATSWTAPTGNAASSGGFDAFGHTSTTTNGTSANIDDAFDLLSSRTDTSSTSQGKTKNTAMDGFDPLTGKCCH